MFIGAFLFGQVTGSLPDDTKLPKVPAPSAVRAGIK